MLRQKGPESRSGPLRIVGSDRVRLGLAYVLCLRAFLSLHDLKLHVVTLLQALIAFRLDGAVVDENIRAVIPADEAEALCIVKPFDFAFDSRHFP